MALAIAWHIRGQQSMELPKAQQQRVRWTKDMWEDYRAARSDVKAELIKKWGKPKPERKRKHE